MAGYELYVFVVCLISLFSTLALLCAMFIIIARKEMQAIEFGMTDAKLVDEYIARVRRAEARNKKPRERHLLRGFLLLLGLAAILLFAFTLWLRFSEPTVKGSLAVPRVVLSDSMSEKHEANKYLTENNLSDQLDIFDLILTRELPGEFELELYDVVVYEYKGELIIHRIIGIEEPNARHPDHRLFQLRGDALRYSDEFAVEYSQMRSIYRGERVPFVGSFIFFLQSPIGSVCIALVIVGLIVSPIVDAVIQRKRRQRLRVLGFSGKFL